VLLVTHDLSLAAQHASHAVLFAEGTVETGLSAAMLTEEKMARVFDLERVA
jgi:ABC-type hemin transport system ATPase subunit